MIDAKEDCIGSTGTLFSASNRQKGMEKREREEGEGIVENLKQRK